MLNITLRKNQVEKMVELLETDLETLVDMVNNELDSFDSLKENFEVVVETLIQLNYEPKTSHCIQGYQMVGKWEG